MIRLLTLFGYDISMIGFRTLVFLFIFGVLATSAHASLLGRDNNHDGVRDDVAHWIDAHAKHPIQRALYYQAARALQRQIALYGKVGHNAKRLVTFKKKYLDAYTACEYYWTYASPKTLYRIPNGEGYFTEHLEKIQFNTPQRRQAFDALERILEQRSCPLVEPDKNACEFDALNLTKPRKK